MVFIHLESAELNQARIAMRVQDGGHDVPAEKVISRIPRRRLHVRDSIPLVDVLRVDDNSSALDPFRPVITINQGMVQQHQDPLPAWAVVLVAGADACSDGSLIPPAAPARHP